MTPPDAQAFVGMIPFNTNGPPAWMQHPVQCPVCQGYGGWISIRDHRGPGKHQIAGCNQCNAWGFVEATGPDSACVHDYREITLPEADAAGIHYTRPGHVYRCTKCPQVMVTDSSD